MNTPPPEFISEVKQLLEHLYDFSYLQAHPLAQQLANPLKRPSETHGHHLRRELVKAIEALSPGPQAAPQAADTRLYNLLQWHYIDGLTVQNVGERMGLSARQVHRSLRRAEESVATLLWALVSPQPTAAPTPEPSARQLSSAQIEMAHLDVPTQPTEMGRLLAEAYGAVQVLADGRALQCQIHTPESPLWLPLPTAVAQQILVSLLGRIIQQAKPASQLTLIITAEPRMATIQMRYQAADPISTTPPTPTIINQPVRELAPLLGWEIREVVLNESNGQGETAVLIHAPRENPLILVIDDNEGLVALLERYLESQNYRVVSSTSGAEGLQLAQQLIPSAVILDIMMPEVSGWQVLQTLRNRPATAETPVIICSLFNDPDLAYSLGASRFLSKPISRNAILDTLRELGV